MSDSPSKFRMKRAMFVFFWRAFQNGTEHEQFLARAEFETTYDCVRTSHSNIESDQLQELPRKKWFEWVPNQLPTASYLPARTIMLTNKSFSAIQ